MGSGGGSPTSSQTFPDVLGLPDVGILPAVSTEHLNADLEREPFFKNTRGKAPWGLRISWPTCG